MDCLVNYMPISGCTPLMVASYVGQEGVVVVKRLLAMGASLDLTSYCGGETALHWACFGDQPACVRLLVDAGAPLTAVLNDRWTPLMQAAKWDRVECVKVLLELGKDRGLDLEARGGYYGHMALMMTESPEIVELLLEAGAEPTLELNNGSRHTYSDQRCAELVKAAAAAKK